MHDETLSLRRSDFRRRADYAASEVLHCRRGLRYIPVHAFADGSPADLLDAWCEFPGDIALVESQTASLAKKKEGIWIRRDESAPRFLKIFAVLDVPAITRSDFEALLERVADHPWSADGFRAVTSDRLVVLPPS